MSTTFAAEVYAWDVAYEWGAWLAEFNQYFTPLDEMGIELPKEVQEDIVPYCKNAVWYKGALVWLPRMLEIFQLNANKDILDTHGLTMPKTYEEFLEACEAVHKPDEGIYAFCIGLKQGYLLPVYLCFLIIELCLVLYAFTLWPHVLNTFMVNSVMFVLISISAIIFAWRRPDILRASPIAKYKPLIVAFGIISVAFMLLIAYFFVTVGPLGINDSFSLSIAIWAAYCVAPIYWFFWRAYRRRQGIDLDLLYKEAPPA